MRGTAFAILIGALGCGGGGSDGAPAPAADVPLARPETTLPTALMTRQDAITKQEFETVVGKDQDLQQLVTEAKGSGYSDIVAAGVTEDDANTVATWAVIANPASGAEQVFVQHCTSDGTCTSAKATLAAGDATFAGPGGKALAPLLMGRPAMAKDLEGHDHDGKTTLAAKLTKEELVEVDLGKRRFILANAYGPVFGMDLKGLTDLANQSAAFTLVDVAHYARPKVIEDALLKTSPFDVLVWVGASVREDMSGSHKTVGMTVNRGVYGDETFQAASVKDLLKKATLGGPGLVLLIGSESRGDGSSQAEGNLALFKELSGSETRTVVGFDGKGDAAHLLEGASAFLQSWFSGQKLTAAIAAGNAALEARGATATMVTNRLSSAEKLTFPGKLADFWGGKPSPKAVRTTLYVNITNVCFPADGSKPYSEDEGQASFFVDSDFDGPFFSGARQSVDVGLDVKVGGALLGTKPGDQLYLRIEGDLKPSMKGIVVYGRGVFVEPSADDLKDHPNRKFFIGDATATDYVNDKGDKCTLKTPKLTGATSQPSWLDLPAP